MRLLVCEAEDAAPLIAAARRLSYRYSVYRGEGGHLLLIEAAPAKAAAELEKLLGLAVRVFELVEEGCAHGDDT